MRDVLLNSGWEAASALTDPGESSPEVPKPTGMTLAFISSFTKTPHNPSQTERNAASGFTLSCFTLPANLIAETHSNSHLGMSWFFNLGVECFLKKRKIFRDFFVCFFFFLSAMKGLGGGR